MTIGERAQSIVDDLTRGHLCNVPIACIILEFAIAKLLDLPTATLITADGRLLQDTPKYKEGNEAFHNLVKEITHER